jgi:hypothetical protein
MLATGLPIVWFALEFQDHRWLRLVLGSFSILLGFGVAVVVGSVERFDSNAWLGNASKHLVDSTIAEWDAGNREGGLKPLKFLQQKYWPTYENRARCDVLVEETIRQVSASPHRSP